MLYPEYRYVDVAKGDVFQRNNIKTVSEAKQIAQDGQQCYSTYYRYTTEMVVYVRNNNGSVKEFAGNHYADYFPIDVDNDKSLEQALETARNILNELSEVYDVNLNNLWIFFSGNKGFHILIPQQMVGYAPDTKLSQQFKEFAKQILSGYEYDSSIYDTVRLFRCNNTMNSKSGLYKIPLSLEETMTLSVDEIKALATAPRKIEMMSPDEMLVNDSLKTVFDECCKAASATEIVKSDSPQHSYTVPKFRKLCYEKMLRQTAGMTNRNETCVRLAYYFKHTGMSHQIALNTLLAWGLEVDSTGKDFTQQEIKAAVKSVFSGNYEYGCNDDVCKKYCDKRCDLYKHAEKDIQKAYFSFDEIEYQTDFSERVLSNIPQLDYLLKGFTFDCITIWTAVTSAGKTTLLSQIATETIKQGYKVFYFNGEQTNSNFKSVLYRQMSIKGETFVKQYKTTNISDVFVNQQGQKRITAILKDKMYIFNNEGKRDIDSLIKAMEQARTERGIRVFMLDNFMQIDIDSEQLYQEQSRIMEELRTFAVNKEVHIHLVAHPKKLERFAVRVSIHDISGSMNMANKAYNIVGITRVDEMETSDPAGYEKMEAELKKAGYLIRECSAVLEVLKTKGTSTGLVGLNYDSETKRYSYVAYSTAVSEMYKTELIEKAKQKKQRKRQKAADSSWLDDREDEPF